MRINPTYQVFKPPAEYWHKENEFALFTIPKHLQRKVRIKADVQATTFGGMVGYTSHLRGSPRYCIGVTTVDPIHEPNDINPLWFNPDELEEIRE